ncbi:hypothetical protein [Streptomyces sp. CB03238]|uniref:hypothetical protein n=1 Tax=Streptomyces sp. CB03238 TaxID=1907777 RepID=UPI000A111AF0|nr:hypothetical protein [Streptomyces sp. CB03238]ORT58707.1 hypothetical protein BKD26_16095 [Streptomyces sp. CB03238]
MVRNVIGSILALVGAAAAVWSPFRAWYDGRHGRDYRIADLFSGISGTKADLWISILLPFAFAALVTLVGLLLRSRLLVVLAGLIVLGFTILWMIRQGQAAGSLSVESDGSGLGPGVALAAGGGVLLLLAAVLMSGRRRAHEHDLDEVGPGHTWGRGHGRRRRGRGEPERHEEPYAGPGQPYEQRPYADDTRTAEYPRYDDRPGEPGPGPAGPDRPGPPHRG